MATEPVSAPSSDTNVKLHPLVLLAITDYITRHTLTNNPRPIIGAILGQRDASQTSMRHAFECNSSEQSGAIHLDWSWLANRLEQYRDVHKAPALDLTALFVIGPSQGSLLPYEPVIRTTSERLDRKILLLVFHPNLCSNGNPQNGQLPISIYEPTSSDGAHLCFNAVPYEIETTEAEFVSLGYVSAGGANARSIENGSSVVGTENETVPSTSGQSKTAKNEQASAAPATQTSLSAHEEELIANMTAQYNAVKMLRERIGTIQTYLAGLPQTYLTHASHALSTASEISQNDHMILRSIASLLGRLPLLQSPLSTAQVSQTSTAESAPQAHSASRVQDTESDRNEMISKTETEAGAERGLVTLLATLTRTLAESDQLSRKHKMLFKSRQQRQLATSSQSDQNNVFGSGGGDGSGDPSRRFADGPFGSGSESFSVSGSGPGSGSGHGSGSGTGSGTKEILRRAMQSSSSRRMGEA